MNTSTDFFRAPDRVATTPTPALPLDAQLAAFRQNRFLAMPVTGALVWSVIAVFGATASLENAVLATYLGTGVIFYLGVCVAKVLGEDLLGRNRKGNLFDRIFISACGMSCLVYALGIPFHLRDITSVPLSVGVLTGLMWLPFSVMLGHWVGYFHALARTALLVAAWFVFPEQRFVVLPAIVVVVYLVSIAALIHRWRTMQPSIKRQPRS